MFDVYDPFVPMPGDRSDPRELRHSTVCGIEEQRADLWAVRGNRLAALKGSRAE
jgi:addiction module HigA family antidote